MRIAILTWGTRGDVQPYLALAKGLAARGHAVSLAAPDNFQPWIESHGVAFRGMGADLEALLQTPELQRALAGDWLGVARIWRERLRPLILHSLEATSAAAREAELIVHHPKVVGAPDVAEATGAALVCLSPVPMLPTGAFPALITTRNFGPRLNRLTWSVFRLARAPYSGMIDAWRKRALGLGPGRKFSQVGEGAALRLTAVSPAVLERPADWPPNGQLSGYLFLEEGADWRPDPALAAFLQAGPPPVYIGLGSMTLRDPEAATRRLLAAARQAGVRALIAGGWGGLSAAETGGADAHFITSAPHDALFPHMAAVVHHAGAGTTAAGLRAGKPSLGLPQAVDQPFWAARIAALGCGPAPLRLRQANVDTLAARLRALVETRAYRTNAAAVAGRIAQENGLATTIALLEAAALRLAADRCAPPT